MALRNNFQPVSGNLNTLVAGSQVNGATFRLGDQPRTLGKELSARVAVTAATATITVAVKFQVSTDGTTFYDVANGSQNAASVVLATGTSAIVTKVFAFPSECWGWKYARLSLVTGVATGAAGDLYAVDYNYRYARIADEIG